MVSNRLKGLDNMMAKAEMLLGGPGLNGYAFRADTYCVDCGQELIRIREQDEWCDLDASDSEVVPQPIFFGEHDVAQYCAKCGEYMYGGPTVY